MASIKAGTTVEILISGVWEGPYTVESGAGRTPDHLILSGRSGRFEHYYDGIYNTRVVEANMNAYDAVAAVHTPATTAILVSGSMEGGYFLFDLSGERVFIRGERVQGFAILGDASRVAYGITPNVSFDVDIYEGFNSGATCNACDSTELLG